MNNDRKIDNIKNRFGLLIWLFIIGVILIIIPELIENPYPVFHTIFTHLGVAVIIVFLLGITVDWWLKKSLVQDAFKAAIGYLLPDELKTELEWVYTQRIIAVKHSQYCEVKPLKDDLVSIEITIKRTLKNITQANQVISLGLGTDEWFHEKYPSKIIEFGWKKNEGIKEQKQFECKKGKYSLDTKNVDVIIEPQSTLDTWCTFTETKHVNDEHMLTHIYATVRPKVNVKAFEGIEIEASSVQHHQLQLVPTGESSYEFNGTLLPGHPIITRWWKKQDSDKWLLNIVDKNGGK